MLLVPEHGCREDRSRRLLPALQRLAEFGSAGVTPVGIFFERAEPPRFMQEAAFDFARSEDKNVTSAAKIERLHEACRRAGDRGPAPGEA